MVEFKNIQRRATQIIKDIEQPPYEEMLKWLRFLSLERRLKEGWSCFTESWRQWIKWVQSYYSDPRWSDLIESSSDSALFSCGSAAFITLWSTCWVLASSGGMDTDALLLKECVKLCCGQSNRKEMVCGWVNLTYGEADSSLPQNVMP